jgi:hypothetical protein
MAVRAFLLSVLVAVAAAVVPALLQDDDVHAAEARRTLETATDVQVEANSGDDPEPAQNPAAAAPIEIAADDQAEDAEVADSAAEQLEPIEFTERAERAAPTPATPATTTPAIQTSEPVAAEPAPEEAAEPPAAVVVVAAAAPTEPAEPVPAEGPAVETAVDAALFAPVAVAGYSIGDLAAQSPQAHDAQNATLQTGDTADLFPADYDGDLNGDMVEILIPSVGQGALFPADFDGDLNGDMVGIVIPDGAPFPAAG